MADFFANLTIWHWMVFGLGLMALETIVPGAFFLWPGLAALLVGLITVLVPGMAWTTALMLWAVLSILTLTGWIFYRRKNPGKNAGPNTLNRRGEQYVGRLYTLTTPTKDGHGDMHVDDTVWKIVADTDIAAGTQVRVIGVEGTSLRIEAVS